MDDLDRVFVAHLVAVAGVWGVVVYAWKSRIK
jgi:hypothetical protein